MPEREFLVSNREPSARQVRAIATAAVLVLVASAVALPFAEAPLRRIDTFIPIVDTVLLLCDLLTATLLLSQGWVLRSRALIALAAGYFFTALIIIPHALTFPGAFSATGLLGAGVDTTIWIYFFWHIGLPIAVVAYTRLREKDAEELLPFAQAGRTMLNYFGVSAVAFVAVTLFATAGDAFLPWMMNDDVEWQPERARWLMFGAAAVLTFSIVVLWRQPRRSVLDLWLLLALWVWLIEVLMVIPVTARFTLGWYAGRTAGLLSGLIVLLMLLAETSRLYARVALALREQHRYRESRLLSMNEVAASIAHEIKQPLAAIVTNADAASLLLRQQPPALDELPAIMSSISEQGLRAAHVVESIRAMFAKRPIEKQLLDVNDLVRETAALVARELSSSQVMLRLDLGERVPLVSADRLQMQHVLLNLFINAIEAMMAVTDRDRILRVSTAAPEPSKIELSVQDSGVGIDATTAERIFDAFFTTKPQGTGMGLPLCRSIVEAHGGRLWLAGGISSGATFHVLLPGSPA